MQLPPDAEMRAYAACQDALWALDSLGQVFIRTLSASCPTGMHWTRLDLSQLGMPTPAAGPCLPASSGGVSHLLPGALCPTLVNSCRLLGRLLDFRRSTSRSCSVMGLLRIL